MRSSDIIGLYLRATVLSSGLVCTISNSPVRDYRTASANGFVTVLGSLWSEAGTGMRLLGLAMYGATILGLLNICVH